MERMKLILGDCLNEMRAMQPKSIDSIITDPPYGISFMGKEWDYEIPSVDIWRECIRLLKPGGYLLAFAGTRTQHRMACRIEDAGFEIRDMIAWVYGSGFPKSHNGAWGGTALKPALEPITMARKPLVGTVEGNWQAHGTGSLNIDGCRVGGGSLGRWPANLIHDGSDDVRGAFPNALGQQGDLVAHSNARQSPNGIFGKMGPAKDHAARVDDDKSASRFFYCAKASKAERGDANRHPTVKPLALMRYLVKLVTPLGGMVLDPFTGSGTTGLACKMEAMGFIGIEKELESYNTALARING